MRVSAPSFAFFSRPPRACDLWRSALAFAALAFAALAFALAFAALPFGCFRNLRALRLCVAPQTAMIATPFKRLLQTAVCWNCISCGPHFRWEVRRPRLLRSARFRDRCRCVPCMHARGPPSVVWKLSARSSPSRSGRLCAGPRCCGALRAVPAAPRRRRRCGVLAVDLLYCGGHRCAD